METADLSAALPYASVEKHFQERSAELQIPPLRCASVGMTKERATPPRTAVAGQKRFFIPLGGPQAYDLSGRDDKFVTVPASIPY
jgi:hypothetical protein